MTPSTDTKPRTEVAHLRDDLTNRFDRLEQKVDRLQEHLVALMRLLESNS